MSEPREIEAKFDLDTNDRDRIAEVSSIGRFRVQERQTFDQDDIYYDTADTMLAGAGATLRVRQTPSGARMTFKGQRDSSSSPDEAHIASRLEDEVELAGEQLAGVSVDAAMPDLAGVSPLLRAREIVGSRELHPVAHLQNARTTLLLVDDAGASLELTVDDCVGIRLSDGRTTRFGEVELETKSAGRDALIETAEAIRTHLPFLRPSMNTKLGRTLG